MPPQSTTIGEKEAIARGNAPGEKSSSSNAPRAPRSVDPTAKYLTRPDEEPRIRVTRATRQTALDFCQTQCDGESALAIDKYLTLRKKGGLENLDEIVTMAIHTRAESAAKGVEHSVLNTLLVGTWQKLSTPAFSMHDLHRAGPQRITGATAKIVPDAVVYATSNKFEWGHKIRVVIAEDKVAKMDKETVIKQFETKFRYEWNLHIDGSLPFVFGVATWGPFLQFLTLTPEEHYTKFKAEDLWKELDLRKVGDRVTLIAYAVRLFRACEAMVMKHASTEGFPEEKWRSIFLSNDDVSKMFDKEEIQWIDTMRGKTEEDLINLYSKINEDDRVPRSLLRVEVVTNDDEIFEVCSTSVGCQRLPQSAEEAETAFKDALAALAWLHEHGWVHRDVRWPNILKMPNDGRFVLIDYESAARVENEDWPDFLAEKWRRGLEPVDGKWPPHYDLVQLSRLARGIDESRASLYQEDFGSEKIRRLFERIAREPTKTARWLLENFDNVDLEVDEALSMIAAMWVE